VIEILLKFSSALDIVTNIFCYSHFQLSPAALFYNVYTSVKFIRKIICLAVQHILKTLQVGLQF